MPRFKQIWFIFGLFFAIAYFGALSPDRLLEINGQSSTTSMVFLTITNGLPGHTYTIALKSGEVIKDQITVNSDGQTTNLNYFPPPGTAISFGDQLCQSPPTYNNCYAIPSPDTFGTSSVTINLKN